MEGCNLLSDYLIVFFYDYDFNILISLIYLLKLIPKPYLFANKNFFCYRYILSFDLFFIRLFFECNDNYFFCNSCILSVLVIFIRLF